jgi:polysaccharide biosynthesis transport protein
MPVTSGPTPPIDPLQAQISLDGPPAGAPPSSGQAAGNPSGQRGYGYGYGYGYPSAPAAGPGFEMAHLQDYLKILYRRRWTAIAAFLIVAVTTAAYTYTRVPLYSSSARLLLMSQRESFGLKNTPGAFDSPTGYQTQYALLGSRWVARHAMESLGMLKPRPSSADVGGESDDGNSIATSLANESPEEAGAISGFLGGLTILPVANSGLVDVLYSSGDPNVAAERANAVAAAYVKQTVELRSKASREASGWLTDLLTEQRSKVTASEQALQRYREQHNVIGSDDRSNPLVQNLGELATAATKAKTERIEKETTYRRLRAIQDNPAALESFPAVINDPGVQKAKNELQELERQYAAMSDKLGERHPDLIKTRDAMQVARARLNLAMSRVADTLQSELQSAQATESSMSRVFESQKNQALAANRGGVELAVLIRDLESNRQIYDSLVKQSRELDISGEIRMNTALILENARVPGGPVYPNHRKNLQFGFVGGLIIGIGLAFFFEYLDSRIKSPDEIKKQLGIPFLGLVPAVSVKDKSGKAAPDTSDSGFGEAFRGIRTNLIFSSAAQGTQSIVITSTMPSEGKTVVSSNIAMSIAETGQRVLLIDADMRRPRVHEVFALPQEPGLSNLLVGTVKPAEAIHHSKVKGLHVITAGRTPPNPGELLGSKRFRDFLAALKDHFDWVIIDTPPVLAVSDAPVVAHNASGLVFVLAAGQTSRHNARVAIEQLHNARANILGAVLNRVELKRHSYYYSKYYRKDYAKYYRKSTPGAQA